MVLCCRNSNDVGESEPEVKNGLVPSSKRKCRDVFCCVLFLVYWLGMVVVAVVGIQNGEPMSLVYGRDYNGSVCGDGENEALKLTAYPRLEEDMLAAMVNNVPLTKMPLFGVCVRSCPLAGDHVCTYDNATCWTTPQDTTPVLFRCLPLDSQNETVVAETCLDPQDADPSCTFELYVQGKCTNVCKTKRVQKNVWEVEATTPNPIMDQLQGYAQTLGRLVSDTRAAASLILAIGGGGALILGVFWLVVLQFFAGCVVWLTCWLVIVVLVLMSLFCSVRSGIIVPSDALAFLNGTISVSSDVDTTKLEASGDSNTRAQFKVAAYIMWVITGVIVLLLVAMRKRIRIAVAIIREASKAIRSLPMLLLWPIIPTILFIALVIYSVVIAAFVMSSSDLSDAVKATAALATNTTTLVATGSSGIDGLNVTDVAELPTDKLQQALLGYHLFGFLWTNQLIQAISITTIAGSIAQYYWTTPDAKGKRSLEANFPILRALKNVVRYSIGSLCFGSFIIALVQFLRIILEYIDHQTQQLQQSNRVVKIVFLAVRCCLWCFEKCLKFLSKNAYIVIAMRGTSFCAASVASFKLVFKNLARVAVVNAISFFMLFLVKTTITAAAGGVVFVILTSSDSLKNQLMGKGDSTSTPVTSPLAPVLITSILAWLVASAFTNVYDAAIDTILLCFCEDTELNGENVSEFMSDELRRIMGGGDSKRKVIQVAAKGGDGTSADQHVGTSNKVHVEADI